MHKIEVCKFRLKNPKSKTKDNIVRIDVSKDVDPVTARTDYLEWSVQHVYQNIVKGDCISASVTSSPTSKNV